MSQFIEQPKAGETAARAADDVVDDIDSEGSLASIAQRKQVADLHAQEDVPLRVEVEGDVRGANGELPTVESPAREVLRESTTTPKQRAC